MTCTHCGRDNHDSIDCFALWSTRNPGTTVADRDPDFEAAGREARRLASVDESGHYGNLARAYLATREREARLVALVREFAKCHWCAGSGKHHGQRRADAPVCDHCSGTGLVEAARRELSGE